MKLLPDSIKQFIVNRLLEISGITTIVLSIFILISVASYSSFDPSILNLNNYLRLSFQLQIKKKIIIY